MQAKEIRPSYETLPSGEMYSDLLDIEYMQCYDEGLDIEPLNLWRLKSSLFITGVL